MSLFGSLASTTIGNDTTKTAETDPHEQGRALYQAQTVRLGDDATLRISIKPIGNIKEMELGSVPTQTRYSTSFSGRGGDTVITNANDDELHLLESGGYRYQGDTSIKFDKKSSKVTPGWMGWNGIKEKDDFTVKVNASTKSDGAVSESLSVHSGHTGTYQQDSEIADPVDKKTFMAIPAGVWSVDALRNEYKESYQYGHYLK